MFLFLNFRKILTIVVLAVIASYSAAATVQDSKGEFTIDYEPQRIVVLEFSFVDALAAVGISPVGIADDKDKDRILPQVRDIFGDWTSVGTRSQPSLEVIASLTPDLIIADISRHEAVYEDLQKIAPTLILPSRRETYEENLQAAVVVGTAIGKQEEIEARLAQHRQKMNDYAAQLPGHARVQFGVARDDLLSLHSENAYAGGVLKTLGFENPKVSEDGAAYVSTGLEQLLAINADYLIFGYYSNPSIVHKWHAEPLWSLLKAVQDDHVYEVNANTWSRARGMMAAETMAQDLVRIFAEH